MSGSLVLAADYDVVAVDRELGTIRWRFRPSDGYGAGLFLGAVQDGVAFAGSPAGRLYAIDVMLGIEKWKVEVGGNQQTTVFEPTTDGQFVVAGYTTFSAPARGGLIMLDAKTGRQIWSSSYPSSANQSSGSAGGPVLSPATVIGASADSTVRAFNLKNGVALWSATPAPRQGGALDYRFLAAAGTTVVAGSWSSPLEAFDAESGRRKWRASGAAMERAQLRLAVAHDTVYVCLIGGSLIAIQLETGIERWQLAGNGGQYSWPPALSKGVIYLAGTTAYRAFRP